MSEIFLSSMTQLSYTLIGHVAVLSLNNAPVNALSKTLSDESPTAHREAETAKAHRG